MGALLRVLLIAAVLGSAWYYQDGFGDLAGALRTAGVSGILAMTLFHLLPMGLCGTAWGALSAKGRQLHFLLARWVREGVTEIAGFVPLSGEVAGARVLSRRGMRSAEAAALTVVDVTAEVIAQFLFTIIGLSLWLWRHPSAEMVRWGIVGLAVTLPVLIAMVFAQRSSLMRFLETLPARLLPKVWQAPDMEAGVHAAIAAIYGDRGKVLRAVGLHLAAWLVSSGEAALALMLLGHPLGVIDVIALESAIFALRSGAFFIPGAVGVQEGGYVLVGAALGLPADLALAVSLLKRGRELTNGVPALFAWHFSERRR
jgi:putative membrane protein